MRSVDKQTRAQIEEAQDKVRDAAVDVQNAHETLVDKINEIFPALTQAIAAYNEAVTDYNSMLDDVITDIDGYMEEKSERWLEGDKGQAYGAWKTSLEEAKIEQVGEPDPPEVDCPEVAEPEELPSFSIVDWSA